MVLYIEPIQEQTDNIEEKLDDRYIVPAVEQAAIVLFLLASSNSTHLSLIDICKSTGIPKSKAFSILKTLQKYALVQRNIDGKGYSLGPGIITLSRRALDKMSAPRLADPILKELAEKTGGTAIFGLIGERGVFVAAKKEGEKDIGVTIRIGSYFPLTYGSHGKAIAAFLPDNELEEILKKGNLYFHGSPEKFDRKRFEEEIEKCREQWFAVDMGEMKQGVNTVATPVFGAGGTPVGYIVVISLASQEVVSGYGPIVVEAGKRLSEQLGADLKRIKNRF
ncbi:MAG: IclR family transcriptional regulator [Syntrophorhabdaceae bacterium]|nr:IclR family transcriptional regulator [Syntrophorhabdaceae bacterium]